MFFKMKNCSDESQPKKCMWAAYNKIKTLPLLSIRIFFQAGCILYSMIITMFFFLKKAVEKKTVPLITDLLTHLNFSASR